MSDPQAAQTVASARALGLRTTDKQSIVRSLKHMP